MVILLFTWFSVGDSLYTFLYLCCAIHVGTRALQVQTGPIRARFDISFDLWYQMYLKTEQNIFQFANQSVPLGDHSLIVQLKEYLACLK